MPKKLSLKGRDLLAMSDLSTPEIELILKTARTIKKNPKKYSSALKGKNLGMIFQKPSTRTRVSFEVAMYQLGGQALNLTSNELQLKRGETVADTARVLSRFLDAMTARVFSHNDVLDLAKYGTIPVINALSDYEHPCQALADLLTILEHKKTLKNIKTVYVGDGNNVAHSLALAVVQMGGYIEVATPKGYEMQDSLIATAQKIGKQTGGKLVLSYNAQDTATQADVIYVDVWTSMGQEEEHKKRLADFQGFQINSDLLARAKKDCIVMHCLPAHRGEEITDEVVDGPNSVVWDQAENRLHAQKALLYLVLGK
ncbi:MAG: ornithine carbamoyltransferase [Planctomycetota bacterium]